MLPHKNIFARRFGVMEKMRNKTYSIGEAARICGVTEKQIRHWEEKGLIYETRHTFATLMMDAGELPGWVQKMMGHETLQMIHERYYSYIKNYQRADGSAFMERIYKPCAEPDKATQEGKSRGEEFTPNLHQEEKGESDENANSLKEL
jgi:integrase